MIKLLTIVGARPQFIKAAAFSRALINNSDLGIKEILLHTGQHFDENMSQIFFKELKIPAPDYNLQINNASHAEMTGQMLMAIEKVINKELPNAVLVYGDTNSTLAGALAAAKLHIPVIHIEAGLRSYNKNMPEELNRVVTDHISNLLFCPTEQAVINLKDENITNNVHLVGDVMHDTLELVRENNYVKLADLKKFNLESKEYIVLTLHRAENTDDLIRLKDLLNYVANFGQNNKLKIVFPIHPRTKKLCESKNIDLSGFDLCEPFGYFYMQALLQHAAYIFTDSGGLQKEAYFHRVPCVTLRDETEWGETIDHGWNRLWTQKEYKPRTEILDYNINNQVSKKILTIIKDFLE
ncbi:MAG: UDP-N-acetylglucosamine 2-epimerase (non-hydrolyzing) [Gammaproteobacteria bacterium]|nr:UDP-N-acetylglucosamine 2-epimerase (non-hydrolyzing) [Gammaproteobacteria bacterium]